MNWMNASYGVVLSLVLLGAKAEAQAEKTEQYEIKTYQLAHSPSPSDANYILTALRLMMEPSMKIYLEPSMKSISIRATPGQFIQIEKMLHDLDRPKKAYRITYIVTESDSGRKVGLQRFAMAAEAGERVTLKQGSQVPVMAGGSNQFSYHDVGLSFDTTPESVDQGVQLKSKVEQSGVAEDKTNNVPGPPVIRQGTLEGTSIVPLGKVTSLGAIDVPGSTRHVDIDVLVELVK